MLGIVETQEHKRLVELIKWVARWEISDVLDQRLEDCGHEEKRELLAFECRTCQWFYVVWGRSTVQLSTKTRLQPCVVVDLGKAA